MNAHTKRGLMAVYASHRGLMAVHANNGEGEAIRILHNVQSAFETFKAERERELLNIRDRINGITAQQDDLVGMVAAHRIGGGAGDGFSSASTVKAQKALVEFMKTGNATSLMELSPQAAMSSDSDPDGGYSVPAQIDLMIQQQMVEMSPMRRLASIVRVSSQDYTKIIGRRGASSGWVGEREEREATDSPVLGAVRPPIGELFAMPEITARLADDSLFDLSAFLQENVSDEFGVQEGAAFISGNGVNKPMGILSYDTASTVDASRAFGTLQYVPTGVASALSDTDDNGIDALINLVAAVKPSYRVGPGVGWLMNSTTASVLRKLKSIGDTKNYLWQESAIVGQPSTLLGFPIYEDENMSDVGANAFPIAFGNFRRGYTIVDRSEMRLLRDPYTRKGYVKFYFTKRVGGAVTDSNAIKLLKVSTT